MRAEYKGIKDGQVVLKTGSRRVYVPLMNLSDEDQAYVREQYKRRHGDAEPGANTPLKPADGENAVTAPTVDALDGHVPMPFDGFLKAPSLRTWTDFTGSRALGQLQGIDEAGNVLLKIGGEEKSFAAGNFSSEDLAYVIETIQADLATEIFPPSILVTLTPEQSNDGYRLWTDRNGNQVAAKLFSSSGDRVGLRTDSGIQYYPLRGLSPADQAFVPQEMQRRENERQAAEARRQAGQDAARQRTTNPTPSLPNYGGGNRGNRLTTSINPNPNYSVSQPQTPSIPEPPSFEPPSPPSYTSPRIESGWECAKCGHFIAGSKKPTKCPKCSNGHGGRMFIPVGLIAVVLGGLWRFFRGN